MKKNLILLIIVVILGGLAYYLTQQDEAKKTNKTYDFSYRDFAIKDIDKVHKIVLINRSSGVLSFVKNDNDWIINKKYKANNNNMKNMLSVIKKVKIDYVPTDAAIENIMKNMMYDGIKVEIYDADNNALKKYYIGGSPENNTGTYFVMEGSAKPLVMTIPGFRGNLRVRFEYPLDDWRDRTVYAEKIDNIKEVEFKYLFDKDLSFKLTREGEDFNVEPAFQNQKKLSGTPNQKFIKEYLLGFRKKIAEGIDSGNEFKENVLSGHHIVEMNLKRENGTEKKLKLYMNPSADEDIQYGDEGVNKYLNKMILRYYILDEKNDLYLIQYGVFEKLFVPYKSFLTK